MSDLFGAPAIATQPPDAKPAGEKRERGGAPSRPAWERAQDKYVPEPNSGCWLWLGAVDALGYGHLRVSASKVALAHRVAFEAVKGLIPEGMDVLHACDNRGCINPQHLHLGTHTDNMREMVARGRHKTRRGDQHPFRLDREKHLPLMRENARRSFSNGR